MIDFSSREGQYVGVSMKTDRCFPRGRFRVVLYGALNAYGLIGSERNGIAILDLDKTYVLLDEHAKENCGYFGPSDAQIKAFREIVKMDESEFVAFCNAHPRSRYSLLVHNPLKTKWEASYSDGRVIVVVDATDEEDAKHQVFIAIGGLASAAEAYQKWFEDGSIVRRKEKE